MSSKFLVQNSSDYTPLSKMSNPLIQYSRKLPTVVNNSHTLSTNWNVTVVSINPKASKNKAGGGWWART